MVCGEKLLVLLDCLHPVAAFTSELKKTDIYDEQYGRQYEVSPVIKDSGTGDILSSLKVKHYFLLYFAHFGQA